MEDRCMCCGDIVPEGRQVCISCEAGGNQIPITIIEENAKNHIAALEAENERLREERRWIPVTERLPERSEYDWVLVQCKMVPENYYGVPNIAELRRGVWYTDCVDTPLEETLAVKVTHWMKLPEPPKEESETDDK